MILIECLLRTASHQALHVFPSAMFHKQERGKKLLLIYVYLVRIFLYVVNIPKLNAAD